MKNFNILGVQWKIPLLGGEFMKNQYREGDCLKREGAWTVCRFNGGGGGLARKRGGVFEGGWDPDAHYGLVPGNVCVQDEDTWWSLYPCNDIVPCLITIHSQF